jgi:hypothetical protein
MKIKSVGISLLITAFLSAIAVGLTSLSPSRIGIIPIAKIMLVQPSFLIKSASLVLISMIGILTVGSCSQQSLSQDADTEQTSQLGNMTTYRHPEDIYAMPTADNAIPTGWTQPETGGTRGFFLSEANLQEGHRQFSMIGVTFGRSDNFLPGDSPTAIFNNPHQIFPADDVELEVIEKEKRPDGSVYTRFKLPASEDLPLQMALLTQQVGELSYAIMLTTTEFSAIQPLWEESLASFEFHPEAAQTVVTQFSSPLYTLNTME